MKHHNDQIAIVKNFYIIEDMRHLFKTSSREGAAATKQHLQHGAGKGAVVSPGLALTCTM